MAIGPIGETGICVVSRAPEEPRVDLELVPILHHNMEAVNAVESAKTYAIAMKTLAQVNQILAYSYYLNRVSLSFSCLKILHVVDMMQFLFV